MEDVSETHGQPPYPVPPSEPMCFAAVTCLAELHAQWWEHTELRDLAASAGVRVRLGCLLGRLPAVRRDAPVHIGVSVAA